MIPVEVNDNTVFLASELDRFFTLHRVKTQCYRNGKENNTT